MTIDDTTQHTIALMIDVNGAICNLGPSQPSAYWAANKGDLEAWLRQGHRVTCPPRPDLLRDIGDAFGAPGFAAEARAKRVATRGPAGG